MPPRPRRKPTPPLGMDKSQRTPRYGWHAANGDLAAVRSELAAGADPSFGDNQDYSPLHVAVQNGRTEVIRSLLQSVRNPNKTDDFGNKSAGGQRS